MGRIQVGSDSDDDVPQQKSARAPVAAQTNHHHAAPVKNNNNNRQGRPQHHHNNNNNNSFQHDQKKKFFLKPQDPAVVKQQQVPAKSHVKAFETADGTDMPVRENTKVFIDGLPYHDPQNGQGTLAEQLTAFCNAWKVGKVVHISKKDGQGFAYVSFRSPNSVEVAVNVLNEKKFLGRHLRVEVPKLPKQIRTHDEHSGERLASQQALNDAESYKRQVLVSDLPPHAQPDILREVFAQYCPALEPLITKIKMASRNRKAFVTLEEEEQAQELAKFLNGFTILGRRVEASMAQPPGVAIFSPFQMAQQKKEQALAAARKEFEGKVPQGWLSAKTGADAAAAAATTSAKAPAANIVKLSLEEKVELVGDNANKRFPMPVLISNDLDNDETLAAGKDRRRGRQDQEEEENKKSQPKVPLNNAAANARFSKIGARVVYVANLSDDVSEMRLRKHFASAIPNSIIRKCEIQKVNGVSNGIATLEYALAADAEAAVKKLDGSTLGGMQISVELDGQGKQGTYGFQAEDEAVIAEQKKKEKELDDDEMDAYARYYGVNDRKKFLEKYDKKNRDKDSDDDDFDDGGFEEVPSSGKKSSAASDKKKKPIDVKKGKKKVVVDAEEGGKKKKPETSGANSLLKKKKTAMMEAKKKAGKK
jgi:RNA recognition motif-containing protein